MLVGLEEQRSWGGGFVKKNSGLFLKANAMAVSAKSLHAYARERKRCEEQGGGRTNNYIPPSCKTAWTSELKRMEGKEW